jgi:TatD related DNase
MMERLKLCTVTLKEANLLALALSTCVDNLTIVQICEAYCFVAFWFVCRVCNLQPQAPVNRERCVPADIAVTCKHIAEIKGITVQEVIDATTQNAQALFPRAFTA